MEERQVLGVKINTGFTMCSALDYIDTHFLGGVHGSNYICTTNPEFIMKAQEDSEFRDIINSSGLSLPDGIGVSMALEYLKRMESKKSGLFLPLSALGTGLSVGLQKNFEVERISGMSLVYNLCELASKKGYSIFFLGGRLRNKQGELEDNTLDLAQRAAENIRGLFPGINIIGATSAYTHKVEDDEKTISYIQSCMEKQHLSVVDILLVAYNFCTQEKWIVRNKHKIPARVSIGVGRTLDHMALTPDRNILNNNQRRTEWLMSLISNPWKFKRVSTAFPAFPIKVFISTVTKK